MKRKHNHLNFILCFLSIGALCLSLLMPALSVYAVDVDTGDVLVLAGDLVDAPVPEQEPEVVEVPEPPAEVVTEPKEPVGEDTESEEAVEEAVVSEEEAEPKKDEPKVSVKSNTGMLSGEGDELTEDDKIIVDTDLDVKGDADEKLVASQGLVSTESYEGGAYRYIGENNCFVVRVPKKWSFEAENMSDEDGAGYEVFQTATNISVTNYVNEPLKISVCGVTKSLESKDTVTLKNDDSGATKEVVPYLCMVSQGTGTPDTLITYADNLRILGTKNGRSIILDGAGSYNATCRLVGATEDQHIGAGHWGGPMQFVISPAPVIMIDEDNPPKSTETPPVSEEQTSGETTNSESSSAEFSIEGNGE